MPLAPNRNITFPATDRYHLKDSSPRFGVVYYLFGNGKTASKSASPGTAPGTVPATATAIRSAPSPTRSRDLERRNRNYVPDCDLLNLQANRECGIVSDLAFGTPRPTTSYDPETLSGWNNRLTNSEFSMGIQHELMPRVGLMVTYARRRDGNFNVTDIGQRPRRITTHSA